MTIQLKQPFKVKTPISYYGGKQSMTGLILKLIPDHNTYTEAFCGGAAIFFAKKPSPVECINDMNNWLVTFYRAIKSDFGILKKLIDETPASRAVHREAEFVLKNSEFFSDIRVAWALWVQTNMSFSSNMFAGYGYGVASNTTTKKIKNKRLKFTSALKTRLDLVDIENNDALKVLTSRDTEQTFHYVDPPYYNANMGHYAGYTLEDFKALLKTLESLKGKFLLSSYGSEILTEYTERNNWYTHSISKAIVACKGDRSKQKIEVLTANYDINSMLN